MTLAVPFALGALLAAAAMAGVVVPTPAEGQMFRPVPSPGGINVRSNIIQGLPIQNGSTWTIPYQALEAPYQVQVSTDLFTTWTTNGITYLKYPHFAGVATATNVPNNATFRLNMLGQNGSPVFGGAIHCSGCHDDKVTDWSGTKHATALDELQDASGAFIGFANDSCVVCHTVGKGQPDGFVSRAATPQLAGVGCESCHGTAGAHINISGRQYHPVATLAPELCGGCHTGSHHPTYDEYATSKHYDVLPDVSYGVSSGTFIPNTITNNGIVWNGYILSTNGVDVSAAAGIVNSLNTVAGITSGYGRQMSCGPCHSGATRAAMISDWEARQSGHTNKLILPCPSDGAAWGPTCANCHDPHQAGNPKQLRNPTRSTNYFTYFTGSALVTNLSTNDVYWSTNVSTYINVSDTVITTGTNAVNVATNISYMNDVFAQQYDPNIQVCAQCHNSRGARWDGLSLAWTLTNVTYITNGPVITPANGQFGLLFGKTWAVTNTMYVTNGSVITTNRFYGLTNATPSFSRGPHHSPQYNILIGIAQNDYLNTNSLGIATNYNARHGLAVSSSSGNYNTNQCATCHVPSYAVNSSTNVTGHTFALDTKGCALGGCHLSGVPNIEEFQTTQTNSITRIVNLLNQWATNKGPAIFGSKYTNYLANAWEYNTLGGLATITNAGPSGSDSLKVPDVIKQARFDVYMVANDLSLGVHNPKYVPFLLADAETKVIGQFPIANFTANKTVGLTPLSVNFTNLGAGLTGYSWDFGDGSSLGTTANPAHTYTSAGTYAVRFTGTTATTNETVVRTGYITVADAPVVNFTAGPILSGPAPLTVNFTNLSSNAETFSWTFKGGVTGGPTTNVNNMGPVSYTYTNAGTFNVYLKATNPGGSVTKTNNAYIIVN